MGGYFLRVAEALALRVLLDRWGHPDHVDVVHEVEGDGMNATERKLWKRLKDWLPGTVDRVENVATPGFPDVSGTCERGDYWVELKVVKTKPMSANRVVDLLEPSQNVWMVRRLKARMPEKLPWNVFVAVGYDKGISLFKAYLLTDRDVKVSFRLVADSKDLGAPRFIGDELLKDLVY
jgi:hypothetical protein